MVRANKPVQILKSNQIIRMWLKNLQAGNSVITTEIGLKSILPDSWINSEELNHLNH